MPKTKKKTIKVRDLKPKKDAKGGRILASSTGSHLGSHLGSATRAPLGSATGSHLGAHN